MAPAPTPKPKKKVPTWYYVAGGLALVGVYYLYSRKQAAAAAAAAAAAPSASTTAPVGTAAASYGNAGDLSALAPYLNSMQGQPASAPATPPWNTPTVGAMSGSGFLPSGDTSASIATNTGTQTAMSGNGVSYTWLNPQEAAGYSGPMFYEPTPGVFMPYTPGQAGIVGNTPIYAPTSGPQ